MHYLITLLLLFLFFRLGVLSEVLHKLALSPWEVHYGLLALILLSLVNVRLLAVDAGSSVSRPAAEENLPACAGLPGARVTINLNLGGVVMPLFFGLYLAREQALELVPLSLLALMVAVVVYPCSRVSRRRGIVIHLAAAVTVAAVGGLWLGGEQYLLAAYLAAVVGTLVGGDLLHLSRLMRLRSAQRRGIFIGGAGLMDAIFLSGLFAMLTAELLRQHDLIPQLL
ncbi:DUF1614 domain-containing protein [Motiliproteus sediminis]|uniref:DUF1614 domain-containing protein n=1 Tax=Motiliproteus sediminis TaxID=1468178 RepID=UPI001AF010B3|nr:DUF1614 domain-containing protein [Motiliproteus sediminis]